MTALMVRLCFLVFAALLVLFSDVAGAQSASRFSFREPTPGHLQLEEDGAPIYVYNYDMQLPSGVPENRRRSSYLHPVWAPNGVIVTDDFPRDHYHHRGIYWAWPVVEVDGQRHSLWDIRGIQQRFLSWIEKNADSSAGTLGVRNGWFVGEKMVATEEVRIVALPATAGERELQFILTFRAEDGVTLRISGTKDQNKGYGGFNVRFAPREKTVLKTPAGDAQPDSDLKPLAWAELSALYSGKPAAVRVTIDPGNPGFPNGWCLRNYGFLGVNFPGLESYTLEPGKPLLLKYRVTLAGATAVGTAKKPLRVP